MTRYLPGVPGAALSALASLLPGLTLVIPPAGAEVINLTLDALDRGNYRETGAHTPTNANYAAGYVYFGPGFPIEQTITRNFFVFDLSSVNGTIINATLQLYNPVTGYLSPDSAETYVLYDVSTSLATLTAGAGGVPAYEDLGSGTALGTRSIASSEVDSTVNVFLSSATALTYLNAGIGSAVALGGALSTISGPDSQSVFGSTQDLPASSARLLLRVDIQPTAGDPDADSVLNTVDNCTQVANASQCDSDGDGFGNRCDGDLNNNGATNAQDTTLFRPQLGQPSVAPGYNKADINCSGAVNAQDTTLFRQLLGSPPGPSALVP